MAWSFIPVLLSKFIKQARGVDVKQFDWENFYKHTKDAQPWGYLMKAASLVPTKGKALDLGCGAGRDTRYLLQEGFEVIAVDADPHAMAILATFPQGRLRAVQSRFEDFTFEPEYYDLINAQFALPFIPKERFHEVFAHLKASLRPGGIFAGQFFGLHDQWNTPESPMTFFSREQAKEELRDLEVLDFREIDEDGHTADGSPKHWHVYHIVARKPANL
jgi:SAM-dependent methyltransferase